MNSIPEIKLCTEEPDYTDQLAAYTLLLRPSESFGVFSASVKMARDAFVRMAHVLTGIDLMLAYACPNRRAVHLWKHGKNARIRKKNYKRMIKYAERSKERKQ